MSSDHTYHHLSLLIELLEQVRQRPGLFIGPVNDRAIWYLMCFLSGVHATLTALHLLPEINDRSIRDRVIEQRGWKDNCNGPWVPMQQQGLPIETILDELVQIEIETLRTLQQQLIKE